MLVWFCKEKNTCKEKNCSFKIGFLTTDYKPSKPYCILLKKDVEIIRKKDLEKNNE